MDYKVENRNTIDKKDQIIALRQRTMLAENHRERWSKDDKEKLKKLFNEGMGITEMALHFQRSELAVSNQISKLFPRVRKPKQGAEGCKCPQCIHYKECSELCTDQIKEHQ